MRLIGCLVLLLSACSSPVVRCDRNLQPVNLPIAGAVAVAPRSEP